MKSQAIAYSWPKLDITIYIVCALVCTSVCTRARACVCVCVRVCLYTGTCLPCIHSVTPLSLLFPICVSLSMHCPSWRLRFQYIRCPGAQASSACMHTSVDDQLVCAETAVTSWCHYLVQLFYTIQCIHSDLQYITVRDMYWFISLML